MAINTAVQQLVDAALRGGVSPAQLYKYMPVSRATLHAWINGATPSEHNEALCTEYASRFDAAVHAGALPLPDADSAIRAVLGYKE